MIRCPITGEKHNEAMACYHWDGMDEDTMMDLCSHPDCVDGECLGVELANG